MVVGKAGEEPHVTNELPLGITHDLFLVLFYSISLVPGTHKGTIYPPLMTVEYADIQVQNPESQTVKVFFY